jgi:hypothetical protein
VPLDQTWLAALLLIGAVIAYGYSNLVQALAAHREQTPAWSEFGLIGKLVTRPLYLAGMVAQAVGFILAFVARKELPLFLVQSALAGAVGVTALLGTVFLGWRIRRGELIALAGLGAGLLVLAAATAPSAPRDLGGVAVAWLAALLPVWAGLAALSALAPAARGGVLLGGVAGLCFGTGAMCARTVADAGSLWSMLTHPALYVMVAHLLLGQAVMAPALARRVMTAAIATMQGTALASAALAGLLLLGDRAMPGRQGLVPLGLVVVFVTVIALTSVVEVRQHEEPVRGPEPGSARPAQGRRDEVAEPVADRQPARTAV